MKPQYPPFPFSPSSRRTTFGVVFSVCLSLFLLAGVFTCTAESQDSSAKEVNSADQRELVYRFADLNISRYIVPIMRSKLLDQGLGQSLSESLKIELNQFQERLKQKWVAEKQPWPEGSDQSNCSLFRIQNLLLNAALEFDFVADVTGVFHLELSLPGDVGFGPLFVQLDDQRLGEVDPWSPEPIQPRWLRLQATAILSAGSHTLRITQRSPQDLDIWLDRFRLVAVTSNQSPMSPAPQNRQIRTISTDSWNGRRD